MSSQPQTGTLIGYNIYAIPEDKTERGTMIYGLLEEGLAYDFGKDPNDDSPQIAIAVPLSDPDTIDLMDHYFPNTFWASIGAATPYQGAIIFQDFIDNVIQLDDLPLAPRHGLKAEILAIAQKTDKPAAPTKTGDVQGPTKPAVITKPRRPSVRVNFNRLPLLDRVRLVKRLSKGGKTGAAEPDTDITATPPKAEPLKLG